MGLKNHQHYYNWTIEWEQGQWEGWLFCLEREVISPSDGQKTTSSTQIGQWTDIEAGISRSKDIIDEIITKQNNIADKVLNIA
jgi:hypothetical protein